MDLIKITPDNERAKSILSMVSLIEERIKNQDKAKFTSLIIADYYEIIKELITALLLIDGYKTLSPKDLIDYLNENYSEEIDASNLSVLDSLRILRNRIAYEGFFIEQSYLNRNQDNFNRIVQKLKHLIGKKLK
jgi:hypothetical protein